MVISKSSIRNLNLIIAFFISFSGLYALLLVFINLGFGDQSRSLTVPLRMLGIFSFGLVFLLKSRIKLDIATALFLIFSLLYLVRIAIEVGTGNGTFHIPTIEFLQYFLAFVLLPFFFITQSKLYENDLKILFWCIIVGTLLLSVGTYIYYGNIIGQVTRIASYYTDNAISPLILSYNASLGIGVGIAYLMANKVSIVKKRAIQIVIVFSLVPFFLGASRGSMLALAFPFLFYTFSPMDLGKRLKLLLPLLGLTGLIIFASEFLGEGLFNRLARTFEMLEEGNTSDIRIQMWITSWEQFLKDPIFGNSLENDWYGMYPHNLFMEILITTGILGFFTLSGFLILIFKRSIWIIKNHVEYFFIVVIFLQAFMRSMFTGGIYNHSWLAIAAALILTIYKMKNNN